MEYSKREVEIATGFNINDKHKPIKTHSGYDKNSGSYLTKSK